MLVQFTVSNFRSIREPQVLSCVAAPAQEHLGNIVSQSVPGLHYGVLRSLAIYGANASGKSNILKALTYFQRLILESATFQIGQPVPYSPFKLDAAHSRRPTEMELEFICKGKLYTYKISVSSSRIESEELYSVPKSRRALLFRRKAGEEMKFSDLLSGAKQSIQNQLLENQLFLSRAANSNQPQMRELYEYFQTEWIAFVGNESSIKPLAATHLMKKAPHLDKVMSAFLNIADTGIESVSLIESPTVAAAEFAEQFELDISVIRNSPTSTPSFKHAGFQNGERTDSVSFQLAEESNGTVRLYSIALFIWHAVMQGRVFLFDELDVSLHPLITREIIKLFHQSTSATPGQLIFSTHDTSLLDLDLFRRDQIWFTEKNAQGATGLYSLAEFEKQAVRSDIPLQKWYMSGRFGALPLPGRFQDLFNAETKKGE